MTGVRVPAMYAFWQWHAMIWAPRTERPGKIFPWHLTVGGRFSMEIRSNIVVLYRAGVGDYIGIAAGPEHVHPFWADTRTGDSRGWTARVAVGQLG